MGKISQLSDSDIDRIIEANSNTVYKLAYAQVRNKNDADDVYQEVFLRFIKKRPVFESVEHEKAWFIKVTVNCCKNFWNTSFFKHTQPLTDENAIAFRSEESSWLTPLVNKLPPSYRTVVHLFYYEDMPTAKISEILGKKQSTVRVQLKRSREILKGLLEGDESDAL